MLFGAVIKGELFVNGERAGDWIQKLNRETIIVASTSIPSKEATRIMKHGDIAFGRPGMVQGITIRPTKRATRVKILTADAWGMRGVSPEELPERMREIIDLAAQNGIALHETAAKTAAEILMDTVKLRPLQPRWRSYASAAIHGGPMSHIRGGGKDVLHIDRRSAYLRSLYYMFPAGQWKAIPHEKLPLEAVLSGSIVEAVVNVTYTEGLPPIPVKMNTGRLLYPVFNVRGVWVGSQLLDALRAGAIESIEVKGAIRNSKAERVLAPFADRVSELPKKLAKPLYTRIWGKMAARGSWVGRLDASHGGVPMGGLFWVFEGKPLHYPEAAKWYRPDLSAFVVAYNHTTMMRAVRSLKPDSVVATHVDAIWTTDIEGGYRLCGDRLGDFDVKGRGRCHYAAQGRYVLEDSKGPYYGLNGFEKEPANVDEFEAECKRLGMTSFPCRGWEGDPSTSIHAKSYPPDIPGETLTAQVYEGFGPNSPVWNDRGYYKYPLKPEEQKYAENTMADVIALD